MTKIISLKLGKIIEILNMKEIYTQKKQQNVAKEGGLYDPHKVRAFQMELLTNSKKVLNNIASLLIIKKEKQSPE